ncbi:hypothetical protein H9Q73_014357 [Fusarium xylarioides]|nr:hypothetical protein H9Q73_014357 [Fusarium xylarioides]
MNPAVKNTPKKTSVKQPTTAQDSPTPSIASSSTQRTRSTKTQKNEAVSKDTDDEAKDTDSSGEESNEDEVNTTTPAVASDNEDSSDEDAAGFIKPEPNDTVTFPPATKVAINTVHTAISVDDSTDPANVRTNLRKTILRTALNGSTVKLNALPQTYIGVALHEYPFEHETPPESNPDLTVWALIKATAKCSSKGLRYLISNVRKPDGSDINELLINTKVMGNGTTEPYKLSFNGTQNADVMLSQLYGFDAAVACKKCKSKTGPFRECIVKSEDDGTEACGNCLWGHGKVKKCSLVDVDPDDDAEVSVTPAASTTSTPVKTPRGTKRKGVYGDLGQDDIIPKVFGAGSSASVANDDDVDEASRKEVRKFLTDFSMQAMQLANKLGK